jgi:hypothetical protein
MALQSPHIYHRACHGAGGAIGPVSSVPPHPPVTKRALAGPAGRGGPHLQQFSGALLLQLLLLMAAPGWVLLDAAAGWAPCYCGCQSSCFPRAPHLPAAPCRSSIGCCAAHALGPGCSMAAPQHRRQLQQRQQPSSRQHRHQRRQERRRAPKRLLSRNSSSSASSESACKRSCQALGTTTMSEGSPAFPGHGNVRLCLESCVA